MQIQPESNRTKYLVILCICKWERPKRSATMALYRQRDHAKFRREQRCESWGFIMKSMARRRLRGDGGRSRLLLLLSAKEYCDETNDHALNLERRNRISLTDFSFNFNGLSNFECVANFRFCKSDIERMVRAVSWPTSVTRTSRNGYGTSPILATCILLRRFATPCRWIDLELLFGKQTSHMSEIFWECLERFIDNRGHLLTGEISQSFLAEKSATYAAAVYEKAKAMSNCVGFIDGTVLAIARPKGNRLQNVVYNGHKRRHALKYQAMVTPDGLILHAYGPMEGRRHDWTLYVRSGIEEQLSVCLMVNGVQYCIYGDSGYNRRVFMEVPFDGSNLTAGQRAFNEAMSTVRVTVEWIFKEIKLYWASVDFKRKLRVEESPAGMLYLGAMLLTNMRNCCYPNTVSQYFNVTPPSLEVYLQHKDSDNVFV